MKTLTNLLAGITCLFLMVGCAGPSGTDGLLPNIVAERVMMGKDEVVVADISAFRDTVTLPLSVLTEKLEIIRLDNSDGALFSWGKVFLSENYIGIAASDPTSFKLFERKTGKYLRDIGTVGNGPGEYRMIYSAQIDENAGNIYILPWQATQLLVFGIDGSHKEPIPFPTATEKSRYWSGKGRFHVSPDGVLAMTTLPFFPVYAWQQDLKGNLLAEVERTESMGRVDFSSEVEAGKNTGAFDPFLTIYNNESNDLLSHFSFKEKRMVPVFTVKNIQNMSPPYYSYNELPKHFIGNYSPGMEPAKERDGLISSSSQAPRFFIVDKQSLKGAYYKLVMDEFGDMPTGPNFLEGHLIQNITAEALKRRIASLLEKGGLKESMIKKLKDFDAQIDEEDNNIIFLAKLKQ